MKALLVFLYVGIVIILIPNIAIRLAARGVVDELNRTEDRES